MQKLSGQRAVPILALDDGEVIVGSSAIVRVLDMCPVARAWLTLRR